MTETMTPEQGTPEAKLPVLSVAMISPGEDALTSDKENTEQSNYRH